MSTEPVPGLRAERIAFANGVTALVSNNQVEPGKVRVKVRFGTGNRSVAADAPNLLTARRDVVGIAGCTLLALGLGAATLRRRTG